MKKFYLISSIIVFLLILILTLPQIGGSCQFYLPLNNSTSCTIALFQASGLGAVMGGFLILFWKAPEKKSDSDDGDNTNDTLNG